MRLLLAVSAFLSFTSYTVFVMVRHGMLGFLALASDGAWGLRVLLDLMLMLSLFSVWIWHDAPQRGLSRWPYVLLTLSMGSMGALFYLARREYARVGARTRQSADRASK
jgi:hypothetical protein